MSLPFVPDNIIWGFEYRVVGRAVSENDVENLDESGVTITMTGGDFAACGDVKWRFYDNAGNDIITKCPECDGKIQYIGKNSMFCLDCEWDNLKLLSN